MFDLTPEEARLLLNVALMATGRNRFKSAAKILAALERFRPDQVSVANAKAIALISALKFEEAVAYVDTEGTARFPQDAMLKVFKGMALMRLGRKEAAAAALAGAVDSDDPSAVQLARDLLADLERQ